MTMWNHNHKCDWSSSSWPDNVGDDENRNDTVGVVVVAVVIVGERPWSCVASEVLMVVVVTATRMMIDCREQSLPVRRCCIWYVPFI